MEQDALARDLEAQVEALGFELVDVEKGGSKTRPLLRLRIDLPDSKPGAGVSLGDCTRVSRALEKYLDDLGEQYVLEVSSPGVERPLVKRRDWERFAGQEVVVKTQTAIPEIGKRVEGVLLGIDDTDRVRIEVPGREVVSIARAEVVRANLVFRWEDKK